MALILNHYIDLTKVDKTKLKKGKFLEVTTYVDDTTKYGTNASTWEAMTKEQRDAGTKRNYVGNGKVTWTDGVAVVAEKEDVKPKAAAPVADEDLPF